MKKLIALTVITLSSNLALAQESHNSTLAIGAIKTFKSDQIVAGERESDVDSAGNAVQKGDAKVEVMKTVNMAVVDITGAAAASLYQLLDSKETDSKVNPGTTVKDGRQITCTMGASVLREDMPSPVIRTYHCTIIVSSDGEVSANSEIHEINRLK